MEATNLIMLTLSVDQDKGNYNILGLTSMESTDEFLKFVSDDLTAMKAHYSAELKTWAPIDRPAASYLAGFYREWVCSINLQNGLIPPRAGMVAPEPFIDGHVTMDNPYYHEHVVAHKYIRMGAAVIHYVLIDLNSRYKRR